MDYRPRGAVIGNRISVGVKIHQILMRVRRRDKLLSLSYPWISPSADRAAAWPVNCSLIVIARSRDLLHPYVSSAVLNAALFVTSLAGAEIVPLEVGFFYGDRKLAGGWPVERENERENEPTTAE